MVMSSRTSSTTTACPCLSAAVRAARVAISRESGSGPAEGTGDGSIAGSRGPVTTPRFPLASRWWPSTDAQVLPHDDRHVRQPCGLGAEVDSTRRHNRPNAVGGGEEALARTHEPPSQLLFRVMLDSHNLVK